MTATCESCSLNETCKNDLKGHSICPKYETELILVFNGREARVQCVINGKWSEWFAWKEIPDPEIERAQYEKISRELGDIPLKHLWKLFLNSPIPRVRLPKKIEWEPISIGSEQKPDKAHIRFDVAQTLLSNYNFLTLKESEEIYVYNHSNGIYECNGARVISDAIRTVLDEFCTTYDVNETKSIIKDATLTTIDVFDHEEKLVCLRNGFLNLDTLQFHEHQPEYPFKTQIPVRWEPMAKCSEIDKFFSQIVAESDIQTLYEICAYVLYPSYALHKSFLFVGEGANGKSTFLTLLKTFLGENNCAGVNLQSLDNSRFATSALHGKMANIALDIPSKALQQTGTFKMLCGGDLIGAEMKFGKHFVFHNHAKLLFSANKIPETPDDTDAFFRRWMILVFPNKFTAHGEPKADPNILTKLVTPEELSGLLNKAVKALQELLERGYFHGDKPTAEWRVDYIKKSNPIQAFVLDCLFEIPDQTCFITKAALYQGFIQYCRENKLPAVDNVVFSRKVKAYFNIVEDSTATIKGKRARVWRNVRWISEDQKTGKLDEHL